MIYRAFLSSEFYLLKVFSVKSIEILYSFVIQSMIHVKIGKNVTKMLWKSKSLFKTLRDINGTWWIIDNYTISIYKYTKVKFWIMKTEKREGKNEGNFVPNLPIYTSAIIYSITTFPNYSHLNHSNLPPNQFHRRVKMIRQTRRIVPINSSKLLFQQLPKFLPLDRQKLCKLWDTSCS